MAEAHQGDRLAFYREHVAGEGGEETFCVRIVKEPADGSEPVEVCRSKVVFKKNED